MARTAIERLRPLASAMLVLGSHAALAEPVAGEGSPASLGSLVEVLFSLVLVLGVIVLAAWVLRRLRAPSRLPQGTLRALGAFPLGPRERVVLLQVSETQLLVGVAPVDS